MNVEVGNIYVRCFLSATWKAKLSTAVLFLDLQVSCYQLVCAESLGPSFTRKRREALYDNLKLDQEPAPDN